MTLTRRTLTLLAALSCAALPFLGSRLAHGEASAASDRLHLVILHTNDVHGQVLPRLATWLKDAEPLPDSGGLPRVAACVNRVRAEAERSGFELLVLDGGDWFQGTPEGRIEKGRALLAAQVAIGYDGMAVGNHEFDHGIDVLRGHLAAVRPPALLANALDGEGEPLAGAERYRIVERCGLRIALVGFCTVSTPDITPRSSRELDWREPAEVLTELRRELEGEVDWFLPVTHCGVGPDRELARAHPDLPLIVGGHSHSLLRNGIEEGETRIVQAGAKASVVGRVDLWIDSETKRVVESSCAVLELYEEPADEHRNAAVDSACAALVERVAADMNVVIGELTGPLPRSRDPYSTSPSGNLVTDLMRARAGADIGIQNRGGLRADLDAGPVTRRNLFQVLPFDNHLVTVTLTGELVENLVRRSLENGRSGFEFSGMVVEVTRDRGRPRVERIEIGGAELTRSREYTIATNSFTADGGDGYAVLAEALERQVDPILLRDLLEEAFDGGKLAPPTENRYRRAR